MNIFLLSTITHIVTFIIITFNCISASARLLEKVSALVNNEIISLSDITNFKKKLQSSKTTYDDFLPLDFQKAELAKDDQKIIDYLINEKIMDSEIKRLGLVTTNDKLEQEINNIQKKQHIDRKQLKQILLKEGSSFDEYVRVTKTRIERTTLLQRVVNPQVQVSDDDVLSYYFAKNKKSRSTIYEYKLAHIFFKIQQKSDEKTALKKAMEVSKKLKDVSFEKLAAEHSEDPNFSHGGFWGMFKSEELSKDFEDALNKISSGDISAPIKSLSGYHILKLLEKKITSTPLSEEESNEIRNILYEQAYKTQLKHWLEQKRKTAFIRINK